MSYEEKWGMQKRLIFFMLSVSFLLAGCGEAGRKYEIETQLLKNSYLICNDYIMTLDSEEQTYDGVYTDEPNVIDGKSKLVHYRIEENEIQKDTKETILETGYVCAFTTYQDTVYFLIAQDDGYYVGNVDEPNRIKKLPDVYNASNTLPQYLAVDADGNKYIGFYDKLLIISPSGELLREQEMNISSGMVRLHSGNVGVNVIDEKGNDYVSEIDRKSFEEINWMPLKRNSASTDSLFPAVDYDFTYREEPCLYGVHADSGKRETILRMKDGARSPLDIRSFKANEYLVTYKEKQKDYIMIVTRKEKGQK